MFPNIPLKVIDKANAAIDNPNRKMVALQNSGMMDPRMMDVFKLTKHGHRKYNHSVPSAFMAAYMVDPSHAADVALAHLMADRISNNMHDRLGHSDKEVAEALMNKQFEMFRLLNTSFNGRKRRKSTRMFFS